MKFIKSQKMENKICHCMFARLYAAIVAKQYAELGRNYTLTMTDTRLGKYPVEPGQRSGSRAAPQRSAVR